MVPKRLFPLLLGLLSLTAWPANAQCPDGTPPPCAVRRPLARAVVPSPAERARRFLVLPFRNLTGATETAWLVEGSTTLLSEALGQWRELTVVPDERLYPALRRNGLAPGQVMEAGRVRRVAEETGGWSAITGELLATGGRVRVNARATDVVTGRVISRASGEAPVSGDPRDLFQRLAVQLTGAGAATGAAAPGGATTSSLDAYLAYLRGVALMNRTRRLEARDAFRQAVRLDSAYAQAWARLALVSLGGVDDLLNPASDAYQSAQRAANFISSLPTREAAVVRAISQMFAGELGGARTTLQALLGSDSSDAEGWDLLADVEFLDAMSERTAVGWRRRGSLTVAALHARRALELDPGRHGAFGTIVQLYALAGGLANGLVAGRSGPEGGSLARLLQQPPEVIWVAFLESDTIRLVPLDTVAGWSRAELARRRAPGRAAARAWLERWRSVGSGESQLHQAAAFVYDLSGHPDSALRSLAVAESLGLQQNPGDVAKTRMVLLGKHGDYRAAARLADSLIAAGMLSRYIGAIHEGEPFVWAIHLQLLSGSLDTALRLVGTMREPLRAMGPVGDFALERAVCAQTPQVTAPPPLPLRLRRGIADRALEPRFAWPRDPVLAACLGAALGAVIDSSSGAERSQLVDRAAALAMRVAASGDSSGAYRLARIVLGADSSAIRGLDAPWFLERAAVDRVQDRFRAVSAEADDSSVVLTWQALAGSFRWQRSTTPVLRPEYRWRAILRVGDQRFQALAYVVRRLGQPRDGSLEQLASAAEAVVGVLDSTNDFSELPGSSASVRVSEDRLVLVLRGQLAAAVRSARTPVLAELRAEPCIPDPSLSDPHAGCQAVFEVRRR